MTAEQFEQHNKSYVFNNIMKRQDLDENQKIELANKKLQEIVKK